MTLLEKKQIIVFNGSADRSGDIRLMMMLIVPWHVRTYIYCDFNLLIVFICRWDSQVLSHQEVNN